MIRGSGASCSPEDWWAEIDVPEGEARLGQPIELRGELRARLRDTSPFVVWFSRDRRSPGWVRRALDVEDVEGEARIVYTKTATEIRDLELEVGDHLGLSGELSLSRREPRALLLLEYRKLSAAVEVEGRERDWDLVGSRRWFEKRRTEWPSPPPASGSR